MAEQVSGFIPNRLTRRGVHDAYGYPGDGAGQMDAATEPITAERS